MFIKYGVLISSGTDNINRLINQYNFKENKDYELIPNVGDQHLSGTKYKNKYTFHPRAFKFCLMRAKNTKQYAWYYLLLEEGIKYYNDYRDKMNKSEISRLIDKQEETNRLLTESNNRNDRLETRLTETNITLNTTNQNLNTTREELVETTNRVTDLEIQHEELEERVEFLADRRSLNSELNCETNNFYILKSIDKTNKYKYYAIRAQMKINKSFRNVTGYGYDIHNPIFI